MSILPSYMSEAWRCYEQMSREDLSVIDPTLVNVSPEFCDKKVLTFLALECGVNISGISEIVSRIVIRACINSMHYAGTTKALSQRVEALSDTAKVVEWFDYEGEPYHFKIDIAISDMSVRMSAALFNKLNKEIIIYKNVRSTLDELNIRLQNATGKVEVAGAGTLSAKLDNGFNLNYQIQTDTQIAGGGVIDVKLSNEVSINYPVADIKIQGAGIWTI